MGYKKSQGLSDARDAIQSYEEQVRMLESQKDDTQSRLLSVKSEFSDTAKQLSIGLLKELDKTVLTDVESETGIMTLNHEYTLLLKTLAENKEEQERIKISEAYINADAINTRLTLRLKEESDLVSQTEGIIETHRGTKHFFWVMQEKSDNPGLWHKIKNIITLAFLQRSNRIAAVQTALGDIDRAIETYTNALNNLPELKDIESKTQKELKEHEQLIQRSVALAESIDNFAEHALEHLRAHFVSYIITADISGIRKLIRKEAGLMVSKLDALNKKLSHLQDILDHIESEILDRKQHIGKVQSVQAKWKRSKKYYLGSDKSKWLVELPANRMSRTKRYSGTYSNTTETIYGYSDYTVYDRALATGLVFCTFAAFTQAADHDGYVEKQIFSEFQEMDNLSDEELLSGDEFENILDDDGSADMDEVDSVEDTEFGDDS